ncbi:MAG: DUF4176 domain-containing protein [Firmicutes bacterium]|nr:DUF4176 domain-containing protein [Bacillota bacterium]
MKDYLPIGSVVLLVDGEKTIMIYGRKQIHGETHEMFDYVACLYPEGNISAEYTYLFNHEDIGEVIFSGYVNDDEAEFSNILNEYDSYDFTTPTDEELL